MSKRNGHLHWLINITLYILAALLVTSLFMGYHRQYQPPSSARLLDGAWVVTRDHTTLTTGPLPIFVTVDSFRDMGTGLYRFHTTFDYHSNCGEMTLVIPYMTGHGLRVHLNGTVLGTVGDIEKGNSSIWHTAHLFSIPNGFLKEENSLSIDIYRSYEAGLLQTPYLLAPQSTGAHLFFLLFLSRYIIGILMGGLLVIGFVFLISGLAATPLDDPKFYIGIANIALSFFLFDLHTVTHLPVSYMFYKQLSVAGLFITVGSYLKGLNLLLHTGKKPLINITLWAYILLALGAFLIPRTIIDLKYYYRNLYPVALIALVIMLILILRSLVIHRRVITLFIGVTAAILSAFHDIYMLVTDSHHVMVSHIGLTVFLFSATVQIISDILENYRNFINERQKAKHFMKESLHDPLTGVFNRKMLEHLSDGCDAICSALMLDLDDFKSINDTHGHPIGDRVLKEVVAILKNLTRKSDLIIRMGGDEFAIMLQGCDEENAMLMSQRIRSKVEERIIQDGEKTINFGCSIGYATRRDGEPPEKLLARADIHLYTMKARKKNKGA